ncbi:hypothetical protein AMAG_19157 [Allomyces macrogynus ATCC 38327]|uniref:Uncharacterized protein n=1 Tax=Allomyces macrogynus (strain ATCC 38327) TaxID=578462 RepID=A0A0L0SPR3_ALLM3|nr:hypothetical protein AMAG_19157 [Allomyces macrogynus ATCC 38327]|eukprot:KNE64399.1 hypothetical protein AMAG_19157 [Allomyces macrogynus ATCC 38327]
MASMAPTLYVVPRVSVPPRTKTKFGRNATYQQNLEPVPHDSRRTLALRQRLVIRRRRPDGPHGLVHLVPLFLPEQSLDAPYKPFARVTSKPVMQLPLEHMRTCPIAGAHGDFKFEDAQLRAHVVDVVHGHAARARREVAGQVGGRGGRGFGAGHLQDRKE